MVPKADFSLQLNQLQFTSASGIMKAHKSNLLVYGAQHFNLGAVALIW